MNAGRWILAAALLAWSAPVHASPPPSDPAALDRAVAQAAEDHLAAPVREGRTSAAVVVYVRDGEARLEGAWGFEDVERKNPLDFARSEFELASLSKVLTGVTLAVMKDRGLVRAYSDPVNAYLKGWQMPDAFGAQVTLDQLATHTAGLDDSLFGKLSLSPPTTSARTEDLAGRMPGFFAPPGTVVSYSSYGVDVLGQVIADAAGEPFPRAVDDYLLRPLGMDRTYAQYPAAGAEHEVAPHQPWRPVSEPRLYHAPGWLPSVGFMTTGKDMERLLLALLDREARHPAVTAAVQDDMFRVHQADGEYGAAHGLVFDLYRYGGRSVLHHGGLSKSCSCYLALSPPMHAGVFYCHTDPPQLPGTPPGLQPPDRDAVRAAMTAPLGLATGATPSTAARAARGWDDAWNEYLGDYLSTCRGYHGILRLRSVLHPQRMRVARGAHGLRVGDVDGLDEIAPGVFGAAGFDDAFVFHRDGSTGRMMFSRATGFSMYERPPLRDDARIWLPVLAAALLVGASGLAFVLPRWKVEGQRHARTSALGFAALVVTGVGILYGFHAFGDRYSCGVAWPILSVRAIGFLLVAVAAFLTVAAWRAFRRPRGGLPRIHLAALAVDAWLTVALLVNFGLIGFSPLL